MSVKYIFPHSMRCEKSKYPPLTPLEKKAFENIVGKGENACSQHFHFFPTMFSTLPNTNFNF